MNFPFWPFPGRPKKATLPDALVSRTYLPSNNLVWSDMADESPYPAPAATPQALADRQARAERETAALRENLRRRKQQARARGTATAAPDRPLPQAD